MKAFVRLLPPAALVTIAAVVAGCPNPNQNRAAAADGRGCTGSRSRGSRGTGNPGTARGNRGTGNRSRDTDSRSQATGSRLRRRIPQQDEPQPQPQARLQGRPPTAACSRAHPPQPQPQPQPGQPAPQPTLPGGFLRSRFRYRVRTFGLWHDRPQRGHRAADRSEPSGRAPRRVSSSRGNGVRAGASGMAREGTDVQPRTGPDRAVTMETGIVQELVQAAAARSSRPARRYPRAGSSRCCSSRARSRSTRSSTQEACRRPGLYGDDGQQRLLLLGGIWPNAQARAVVKVTQGTGVAAAQLFSK